MSARKGVDSNPFTELVAKAAEDGKRYDLPGRFSLTPFEGRKAACEPYTVICKLPKKISIRHAVPSSNTRFISGMSADVVPR